MPRTSQLDGRPGLHTLVKGGHRRTSLHDALSWLNGTQEPPRQCASRYRVPAGCRYLKCLPVTDRLMASSPMT
ncbi:hypothetical protein E2C01_101133 [Portunus trituberculatus]|uniref:Uncharacterized protein n=1 Tax=Portunus trituberculatus TaxID=210409 RepID=A0A5B7K9V4_PORTR|nr:hypothetical protein [Portunus trituberculatus]